MYENYPLRRILFQTFKDNDIHTIKASFIAKSFDNITIKMKAARPIQETKNKNDCFQLIVCSPVIQVGAMQIIDQPSKKRILKTIVAKFSRKEKSQSKDYSQQSIEYIQNILHIYILYIYLCYIIYIYINLHDRDNTKQSISFIFIVVTQQKQQKCNKEWWGKNSNDNIDDSNKTNNNNNKIRIIAITVVLVVVIIILLLVIIIIAININNNNNNDNNYYYYNK